MKILICTLKSWNIKNANIFKEKFNGDIKIITSEEELTEKYTEEFNPDFIFFPHWSFIIPKEIYSNYNCIVFHMTDLPYGRGGSPLQNLITLGIKETKISAIRVVKEVDAGPIYMKYPLNLNGTAEEIYIRASKIIFEKMIPELISNEIIPVEQEGEVVTFKRRRPKESELLPNMSLEKVYDYIRMLDAEDYPKSFIQYGNLKLSFSRASLREGKIVADVEIEENDNE